MKNSFVENILIYLKKETDRQEFKDLIKEIIQPIFIIFINKLYPYLFLLVFLLLFFIFLNLGIFILFIRNNNK